NAMAHDAVIGRVEDAVAEPGERRGRQHHPEGGDERDERHAGGEEAEAGGKHPRRSDAVDEESGRGLRQSRAGVKDGNEEAELGEADTVLRLDEGEELRQCELIEVAEEMSDADSRDDMD